MTCSTGRSADQHILASLVGHWIDQALHTIQGLVSLESPSTKPVHLRDLNQLASFPKGADLPGGNGVFFISLNTVSILQKIWSK
jgi:hypothetical protein